MNDRLFNQEFEQYWESAVEEGEEFKNPFIAVQRMLSLFERFDQAERETGEQRLAAWLDSDDSDRRFAAMHIVRALNLVSVVPSLDRMIGRLKEVAGQPAIDAEREVAETLVSRLRAEQDSA